MFHILSINPGSTSTKIAVFEDEQMLFTRNIKHSVAELSQFDQPMDQLEYRRQLVIDTLKQMEVPFNFNAVIGRGGLAKPVESGVYEVNERMLELTRNALHQHACDLGCLIAYDIAKAIPGCLPLIADPGVVDELSPLAKISGSPLLPRYCIWHALNQKAIARRYARDIGKRYEDLNLIICHLGGGISIAAHDHGRTIDANNAMEQLIKNVTTETGLRAHLGTNDVKEILQRIDQGDQHAQLILDAMLFHTAKAIASEAAVLYGKVDAILLTGGIAYADYVVNKLKERLDFLAPVITYPGENEMQAMSNNALAVLRGELKTKEYH